MTIYLQAPIVTDPDTIAQAVFDYIQTQYPGWVPNAGNLDTWLIEAVARKGAETATVASTVTDAIFRVFGQKLIGLQPLDASFATVASTWVAIDAAGYTIPAGTLVDIAATGNTSSTFQVLNDFDIPAGETTTDAGAVTLIAVNAGAAASGLGGPGVAADLSTVLDFVASVTLTAATTGGVDAEDDTTYLNRLAGYLQLLSPAPILPADFATLLLNVAGIDRALALDGYLPPVNEIQTVTIDATGGTFTLSFGGHTTTALAYNAAASAVQTALQALVSIGAGNATVTGSAGGPYTVTFVGTLAAANQAQMTSDATSLTGGAHTATVATTRNGSASTTGNPATIAVAAIDSSGNAVGSPIKAAGAAYLESLREVGWTINVIDPTYTQIDVSFTISVYSGYDPAATVAAATAAVQAFLSPANWGLPPSGDVRQWIANGTVRYTDLAAVIRNVQGVQAITALTLAVHGGSLATSDVALTGAAPLPTAGTITGTSA